MNHYIEEVDDGGQENVLAKWKGKALMERAEHMDEYVKRVVRRPLGKVLVSLNQGCVGGVLALLTSSFL